MADLRLEPDEEPLDADPAEFPCRNPNCNTPGAHITARCKGGVQTIAPFLGTIYACTRCKSALPHTTDTCPLLRKHRVRWQDRNDYLFKVVHFDRQGLAPFASVRWDPSMLPRFPSRPRLTTPVLTPQEALTKHIAGSLINTVGIWDKSVGVARPSTQNNRYDMALASTPLARSSGRSFREDPKVKLEHDVYDSHSQSRHTQRRTPALDPPYRSATMQGNTSAQSSSRRTSGNHAQAFANTRTLAARPSLEVQTTTSALSPGTPLAPAPHAQVFISGFSTAMELGMLRNRPAWTVAQEYFANTPGALQSFTAGVTHAPSFTQPSNTTTAQSSPRTSRSRSHHHESDLDDEDDSRKHAQKRKRKD